MNELTQAQLLDRVNTSQVAAGNPRVRAITARIVADLMSGRMPELDLAGLTFRR
jgi:hypothetical protein